MMYCIWMVFWERMLSGKMCNLNFASVAGGICLQLADGFVLLV